MSASPRRPKLSRKQRDAIWNQALALAVKKGYVPLGSAGRFRTLADPAFVRALIGDQSHTMTGPQCASCSAPNPYLRVVPATDHCWEFYSGFLSRARTADEMAVLLCLKSMILIARQGQIGQQHTWKPTDHIIASRDDVLRTGLRSTCRACGEAVFTSAPYPATVPRICEECFLLDTEILGEDQPTDAE